MNRQLTITILGFLISLSFLACDDPDTIESAARRTEVLLANCCNSETAPSARAWMTGYHGEAQGHQVLITTTQWALIHPEAFRELAEGLPADDQRRFVQRFAFAVYDSGNCQTYTDIFGTETTPVLKSIADELGRLCRATPN